MLVGAFTASDWATVASLATAGGTLVLAVATFYSVRGANRAARSAERALLVGLRPVLFSSRPHDPEQKIRWGDRHYARLDGGRAVVELVDDVIYLAMSLRNIGPGIAVLHGWRTQRAALYGAPEAELQASRARPDPSAFRAQQIDLYVAPGDVSYWLAAIRDPQDPDRAAIAEVIENRGALMIDLMYGDHEGGQRTITRFLMSQYPERPEWHCGVVRHWNLDRDDPR